MNSSCVGWKWGGTNVPGGNSACHEKLLSVTWRGVYVWPRMCQTIPSTLLPCGVTPAIIGAGVVISVFPRFAWGLDPIAQHGGLPFKRRLAEAVKGGQTHRRTEEPA